MISNPGIAYYWQGRQENGKTTLAEAIANTLNVPLMMVRYEAVIARDQSSLRARYCQLTVRRSDLCAIGASRSTYRDRFPSRERTCPHQPMVNRFQSVPRQSEEIQNDTVNREEELSLPWRLEPSHLTFPLSGRLM